MARNTGATDARIRQHILGEVGWNVRRVGEEMHGEIALVPELLVPGTPHLRTGMMAAWADQLMGLLAVQIMAPRVPTTLELDVHLYRPAPGSGTVYGKSRLIKRGRTVSVAVCAFYDQHGDVFAEGAGSFMLAGDPDVRLPPSLSIDLPRFSTRLERPIAERARCTVRGPGVATIPLHEDALNAANTLNGGLLAIAVEEAVLSLCPGDTLSSLGLRYLRPVRIGPAVANARLQHGLSLVDLHDEGNDNRLSVTATARTFTQPFTQPR